VLEAIRADPATRLLPVVMLTGYATSAERARAQAEGVTDFLAKPFSPHELLPRVRALVMLKQFADEHEHAERVILTLAKTIDARDPYTAGHSGRVADWADRIAERLGMDTAARNDMRRGALFHDIGRIVVPDSILRKPGVLTAEERQVIEEHPTVWYDLLEPMKTMRRALPVVHGHHERLDGSGYPRGLSAPDITLPVRIVAVADVFDALVSDRAYRRAFSLSSALEVLSEGVLKGWWDRDVVEALEGLAGVERHSA
jgi:putative two-component system response regulator